MHYWYKLRDKDKIFTGISDKVLENVEILESKEFETYLLENPSRYYGMDHLSIWCPNSEKEIEQVEKVKEKLAELKKLVGKHIYIGSSSTNKFFMSPEETETGIKFNCFCTFMFQ